MKIQYNKSGNLVALLDHHYNGIAALKQDIAATLGLDSLDHDSFYSMWNGKILTDVRLRSIPASHDEPAVITIVPRVLGGMLQAVGTQSTTTQQAEEEKEKVEAKKPKLDTVKQAEEDPPLPILDDQTKPEEKNDNVEVVAEAVDQGLEDARESGNVEPPDIASQLTNSSSSCSSFTSDDSNPQTTTPTQVAGSSGNAAAAAGTIDATKNAVAAESSTSEDEPEYLLYSSSDYETDDGVRVKKARIEP